MRPTGGLHLGHYHGVLKNWLELQHEYSCFFFVADWHALTTDYDNPTAIPKQSWDMIVDWLAVGISPSAATLFIQSQVPEHAELHLLLSMITPLGWLERVPTYKDQQEKLKEKDLATYGFLGYPLLQSADILIYKAGLVPVGEDQVAHVEMTRELARRFNYIYGREANFEAKAEEAKRKMGKKNAKLFDKLRRGYREQGHQNDLEVARALLETQANITLGDRERLLGYLEGTGRAILPEPQPLLTKAAKMPGLDGQKMSKSYGNTISLREHEDDVVKKLRTMPTDPQRVRRTDSGDPHACPVWPLHQVYSDEATKTWVHEGCQNAAIGCLECKQTIIDKISVELAPIQARIRDFEQQPEVVRAIIYEGCERARDVAKETMTEVRHAMSLVPSL
jgi:tryptophanyl-tRNA synthetase